MDKETTIRLADVIGTSIHTRESSARLLELVEKNPNPQIELDFSHVKYISRSFADQFYIDRLSTIRKLKKIIIIANANENVLRMLESVEKTHKKAVRTGLDLPVYKLSSPSELEDFLLG